MTSQFGGWRAEVAKEVFISRLPAGPVSVGDARLLAEESCEIANALAAEVCEAFGHAVARFCGDSGHALEQRRCTTCGQVVK